MEEKCLWGIIDELRDDVNAHIDAITDMDAVIDKLQAENKELNNHFNRVRLMRDKLGNERDNLRKENNDLLIAKDDKKRKNHELRNKLADARSEINKLKADIKHDANLNDAIIKDAELIRELKAENEELKEKNDNCSNIAYVEILNRNIDKLKADNDKLKADNKELKEGLSNEGVLMLQDDNKRLMNDNKKRLNEIIELTDDNKRLMSQVSSNRSNSSNGRTHIIKEIDTYKDNNGIDKAYIFVVDADAVNKDGFIADSHAVSSTRDSNCVSIV